MAKTTTKHRPTTVWATRIDSVRPYQLVQTEGEEALRLSFFPGEGHSGVSVRISRRDARLLARRIGQCLEQTRR